MSDQDPFRHHPELRGKIRPASECFFRDVDLGIGTSHMATEHTLRHFRQCMWLPDLIDRAGWGGPQAEAAILAKAQQRVQDLVAAYQKPGVDPDKLARLRAIVDRARKELL